jgi:hypothetical protein
LPVPPFGEACADSEAALVAGEQGVDVDVPDLVLDGLVGDLAGIGSSRTCGECRAVTISASRGSARRLGWHVMPRGSSRAVPSDRRWMVAPVPAAHRR